MRNRTLICLCVWIASSICCRANIQLTAETAIHFASQAEGSKLLMFRDDFVRRLSPFDRAARLKVDHAVSEEEFLTFVGKNVTEWTEKERRAVNASVETLGPLLRALPLSLPPTIQLVKTTGAEEGNAAYTRGTAIILPSVELAKSQEELNKLICHELFHILSRHDPVLRERLYEAIGFTRCEEIEFPPELALRKITNPDAPRNDHFIRVTAGGRQGLAVPILLSSADAYDVKRGGEFFEYLNLQFLMMQKTSDPGRLKPEYENSKAKLVALGEISGFFEQVGRNTQYIIHPEEILADNFALLILKQQDVPSPQILQKMMQILTAMSRPNHG
jgi:hypothetical protein